MPQQYTGEALKTYDRIHVLNSYHYNKLYISPEKIIYHINRHGFLHAYTAGKCKDYDGSKIYYIRDNLLTRDNLLRESLTTFYHSKAEAKAAWEAMQADAEANTAEERPQADAEPHHPANDQERPESAQDCQTENKTTGRPQQTATDREESSPQEPATAGAHNAATTAAKKTTIGQTTTRTDKAQQEATQRPKRGTHSPATYEAHKTATAPAGDQGTTAGDKDNTRSDKAPQRGTQPPQETATTPHPQQTATGSQPATVSEAQEPANDQEPKPAAPCHHPHSPATSPTEAQNARRRTNYHHSRKNATQSHAGSPQEIRSAADCHRRNLPQYPQPIRNRRNLPQGAQQAPQRTEPAQAIHASPCHRKSSHKPRRKATPRAYRQKPAFSGNNRISQQVFGKIFWVPNFA